MIPFESTNVEPEIVTLSDGCGNSLKIPKFGSLTPNEDIEIAEAYDHEKKFPRYKLAVVTAFLKARFNEPTLTEDEVIKQAKTAKMIDAIYKFIDEERGTKKDEETPQKVQNTLSVSIPQLTGS